MLRYEDAPLPSPGPGEALVKIEATGVNFIDIYFRQGLYKSALPIILGQEAAGTVEATGARVTHVKAGPVTAFLSRLRGRPVVNEDGAGGSHVYIPRFNYNRKNNYAGGYVVLPGAAFGKGPTGAGTVRGCGASFKRGVRDLYGTAVSLRAYGERLPDYDNYFEIDPGGAKDLLGIPQVKFHCKERDNERKMMQDMFDWKEQILRACGAEGIRYERYLEPMGDATHECGAARMGNDPKTSVLNRFNQAHDVKNLFVTDASCFVSLPATHGITTWIMALAWRASEYLAAQLKTGL